MESWSVGFDGNDDVERHAGMLDAARPGKPDAARPALHLRVVSDYI